MPTPPILTPEQRAAALEKAAIARRVRAEVKDRLKMGILDLPGLFRETDANPILAKLKVVAVIESLPGVGKVKAKRLMEELEIAESRRLGGLGTKQKAALLAKFSASTPS
ncbi:MAG TPA: integration host factor, actinobacterial type [Acidimicrobiia bacterium]|nr:integration host factor, actinobacterial type [Acidimicrobiia bacterium]